MPVFAVVGAVLGSIGSAIGAGLGAVGAAAGVTGAGVTAGTSMLAGGMIVSGIAGAAESIYGAVSAADAAKESAGAVTTPNAAQTVDNTSTSNVSNLGRAALIMTSPQGVQGTDMSTRYKLLGNSPGLGNG